VDNPPRQKLTPEEIARYIRHLALPEVGMDGQLRLRSAAVLVAGAGGLGSPASLYLAAAGVGRLGLVDFDAVDTSNLQRQVLFGAGDVGRRKVDVAGERLRGIDPGVDVVPHDVKLTSDNVLDVVRDYDLVVDGTDNFPSRYLLGDACVLLRKPHVYGSVYRFHGQASVFATTGGPCYRCLYPEPPPPGAVPSCSDAGVLGVLPGIVGAIQAGEAIKLIVGAGETLAGRLLLFDALETKFRELGVARDPSCPVCGDEPTIRAPVDYDALCGVSPPPVVPEMEPAELKRRLDAGDDIVVLDVRQPYEREICDIGGVSIPIRSLPARVGELDAGRAIVACCHLGRSSAEAVDFLRRNGFERVWNLRGGLDAWSDEVDPTLTKY
jgi:adenylyltransferase/sulfurtransferase